MVLELVRAHFATFAAGTYFLLLIVPSPPIETLLHPHHGAAFLYGSAYKERFGRQ